MDDTASGPAQSHRIESMATRKPQNKINKHEAFVDFLSFIDSELDTGTG